MKHIISLIIVSISVLSGCGILIPSKPAVINVPLVSPIPSKTRLPSASPSLSSSFTQTPSTTPTSRPAPSRTMTLTPKPTATTTWTPLPTLAYAEARAMVRDLLENNGGCKLPCWWGIVPGETDWSSAKQCLSQFTTVGEGQKHWFSEYSGIMQYTMWSAYQYRLGSLTGGGGIMVKNGGIQRLLITTGTSAYRLSQLLKEYGKPLID
jgi:hypothetical protein